VPFKILIADDDVRLLTSLSVRLKAEGFEVVCVQDSYQAVAQAAKHRPDLLILDVNMPAGDGFTAQDRIAQNPDLQQLPVIYITGEQSERVQQRTANAGTFAVVHKPFDSKDLVRIVHAAISSPLRWNIDAA